LIAAPPTPACQHNDAGHIRTKTEVRLRNSFRSAVTFQSVTVSARSARSRPAKSKTARPDSLATCLSPLRGCARRCHVRSDRPHVRQAHDVRRHIVACCQNWGQCA
jgi:hypothetical protein